MVADTDNCETPAPWTLVKDVNVLVGKRALRGIQLSYSVRSCGDWFEGHSEVVTSLFAVEKDGSVAEATQHRPSKVESNLDGVFGDLTTSLTVSGKALLASCDRSSEACDSFRWDTYRETVKVKLDPDGHIAIEELPVRPLHRGKCRPASDAEGG